MPCTVVVGGNFGDEGKGKVIAYLANKDKPNIIARGGVGPNAGHTVYLDGKKYGLRQLPCGFVYQNARLLIGPGVLIDPNVVLDEISLTKTEGRVGIDYNCAIIEDKHIKEDQASEHLKNKIGSTGTGCGPANVDRINRTVKLAKEIPELEPYHTDVPLEVNLALGDEKYVFIENSQGFGLSLYHGTYPYCTSKDVSASSAAADVGIGPTKVDEVILIFKSFPTRVGEGPFKNALTAEESKERGIEEFGTVTGRPRRSGLPDWDMMKRAVMINGATQIGITCIDYFDRSYAGTKNFDDLTNQMKSFVKEVEDKLTVPVTLISTGPDTDHIIDLRDEKIAEKRE